MAVETIGMGGEVDGYGDTMDAFRQAHEANSRALVNIAAKRPKNAPLPAHDPDSPDNQWPRMIYHPEKGELVIGQNLKGLSGVVRRDAEKSNQTALDAALKSGYRKDPYPKPQVAVLDPAAEKAALLARNVELEGKLTVQNDLLLKLASRLDAIEKK